MAKTKKTPAQAFHYFATCLYGWATHDTREGALKKLIGSIGSGTLKRSQEAGNEGIAATVCRVELPEAAHYDISEFMPSVITKEDGVSERRKGERVPLSEVERVRIVNMSGKTVPRT
jgi:hypothetical protein